MARTVNGHAVRRRAERAWIGLLLLSNLVALDIGCLPRLAGRHLTATPRFNGGWQTLRGEHRIMVEAAGQTRRLRAVVAIARPDRVRLRALGPGGISLFDVLSVGGEVTVIRALPRLSTALVSSLVTAIVGDLAAVYDLAPRPPERTIEINRRRILVREPQRELRLSRFREVSGKVYPSRIEILNRPHSYRVQVDAAATWLDDPLDARLFSGEPSAGPR